MAQKRGNQTQGSEEKIYLVEQHWTKDTDPRYDLIDEAAFAVKNLYKAANYIVR